MRLPAIVSLLAAPLLWTSVAAAEPSPAPADSSMYAVGFRVGGYGFRREGDNSSNSWNLCRMNGVGLFAHRSLPGPLFLEAGLDTYFSIGQGQATDLPLDRQSALLSVAAGVRTSFRPWLVGYAQLGTGVELARLAVPYGDTGTIRDTKAMPDGFIGVGADLRIGRGTFVGASVRTLVMGNFDYDPARLQMDSPWVAKPAPDQVFNATPTLASQAQFYIRHEI